MQHPTAKQAMNLPSLRRLGEPGEAGLFVASLPLPRAIDGTGLELAGRPTHAKPLGQWHGTGTAAAPRRLLLACDGGPQAPDELHLTRSSSAPRPAATEPPTASSVMFASSTDPEFHWERHALRLEWNGRHIDLAMGMRVDGELRWWEFGRLVVLSRTETCCEVQMAGSIPHMLWGREARLKYPGYTYPGLHHHHWLSGHIYARLHSNGICEIFARHVNSRFFDDGRPLENAVPVVGIRLDGVDLDTRDILGPWDGSKTEISVGGVRVDLTEASHLASARQPGRVDLADDFVVWQPYAGMELYGGICPKQLTGNSFIYRAEQHIIPRGMGRTLRLSLSLNPDRSPRIARYQAPAWWYGLAEEFVPAPLLPVSDRLDESLTACQTYLREHTVRNGFEDGSIPRHLHAPGEEGRHEPGWEGEAAAAAMLLAYRTGDPIDHDLAMRACYCFTDVYVDHAVKVVRMHGYGPDATSLPMFRIHACVYAYLETGDEFCLDAARAVIDTGYWLHKNSWPRTAVGRDACFLRGAVLLYRFFNDPRGLEIARTIIPHVVASQAPDGWFGDQGGGSGMHGWNAFIVKPWMGLMAVGGLLDYLELFPDDRETGALDCIKRFADWLMRERFENNGKMGWRYQHLYNNGRDFWPTPGKHQQLPTPAPWHKDYLARLMTFCTLRFNDPSYYDAWRESYENDHPGRRDGDHAVAQSLQYLPWVQAMTWRATLNEDGTVRADPVRLIHRDGTPQGTVMAPTPLVL